MRRADLRQLVLPGWSCCDHICQADQEYFDCDASYLCHGDHRCCLRDRAGFEAEIEKLGGYRYEPIPTAQVLARLPHGLVTVKDLKRYPMLIRRAPWIAITYDRIGGLMQGDWRAFEEWKSLVKGRASLFVHGEQNDSIQERICRVSYKTHFFDMLALIPNSVFASPGYSMYDKQYSGRLNTLRNGKRNLWFCGQLRERGVTCMPAFAAAEERDVIRYRDWFQGQGQESALLVNLQTEPKSLGAYSDSLRRRRTELESVCNGAASAWPRLVLVGPSTSDRISVASSVFSEWPLTFVSASACQKALANCGVGATVVQRSKALISAVRIFDRRVECISRAARPMQWELNLFPKACERTARSYILYSAGRIRTTALDRNDEVDRCHLQVQ